MKAGAGKAKGAEFEREICRRLSLWLSRGRSDDLFWRSAMSGGRATIGKRTGKERKAQAGDITALGGTSIAAQRASWLTNRVVIECKFLADYQFQRLIFDRKGPLHNAIVQAHNACGDGQTFAVIAKANRKPTLVICQTQLVLALDLDYDNILAEFQVIYPEDDNLFDLSRDYLCAIRLESLLNCAPSNIRKNWFVTE